MKEQIIYLDSSAIVRRYIKEPGSDYVREIYLKAYPGRIILSYSIWSVGEVLGALDKALVESGINQEIYDITRKRLLSETRLIINCPDQDIHYEGLLGINWEISYLSG